MICSKTKIMIFGRHLSSLDRLVINDFIPEANSLGLLSMYFMNIDIQEGDFAQRCQNHS